jgi:hypothetical protein
MAANQLQEGDLDKIWSQTNLLRILCERHRIQARNSHSTDYPIEVLNQHYGGWPDSNYFRMCIGELARIHLDEIQVQGNQIQVRRQGIINYSRTNSNFQLDFELPPNRLTD